MVPVVDPVVLVVVVLVVAVVVFDVTPAVGVVVPVVVLLFVPVVDGVAVELVGAVVSVELPLLVVSAFTFCVGNVVRIIAENKVTPKYRHFLFNSTIYHPFIIFTVNLNTLINM